MVQTAEAPAAQPKTAAPPAAAPDEATAQRLEAERLYHNSRFGAEEDPRAHLDKLYAVLRPAFDAQDDLVRGLGAGKDVLEYGCADGSLALRELGVPRFARSFLGIDISDAAIDKANARAAEMGFANARFAAMNAEALEVPDASLDLVYGRGIIHHLDLSRCFPEVARVLRPGGSAVFAEPLGHNPVLNWYRSRTPELRTHDEHPLVMDDLELGRRFFSDVSARYFGLTALAAVPLRNTPLGGPALRALGALDRAIFAVPPLRKQAWYALITLRK